MSPPPPDEKRSEIIQALAARVGLADVVAGSPRDWKAKMIAPKLGPHGITVDTLEAGPLRNPLAETVLFADRKFATPSGKSESDRFPSSFAGQPSTEYPLLLMALSTPDSQSSQWVRPQQGLAELTGIRTVQTGIPHGGTGVLASVIGKMQVRVFMTQRSEKDVAIVPKGGHLRDGRCANALTEAALTDLGEGGALYDQPVKLTPPASPLRKTRSLLLGFFAF